MIELAQRLGVHTVAEGIERPEQVTILQSLGADLGQGYYFSRPVTGRGRSAPSSTAASPRAPLPLPVTRRLRRAPAARCVASRAGAMSQPVVGDSVTGLCLLRLRSSRASCACRCSTPTARPIGRIQDVVIVLSGTEPPRVLGLRRRSAAPADLRQRGPRRRVRADRRAAPVRHHRLRPFRQRPGEQLAVGDLFDKRVGDDFLTDLAIEPSDRRRVVVGGLGRPRAPGSAAPPALAPHRPVERGRVLVRHAAPEYAMVAELREMHPSDVASRLQALSPARRQRAGRAARGRPARRPHRGAARRRGDPHHREPRRRTGRPRDRGDGARRRRRSARRPARGRARRAPRGDDAGGVDTAAPAAGLRREHRRRAHDPRAADPAGDGHGGRSAGRRPNATRCRPSSRRRCSSCSPPTSTPTGTFLGAVGFQRLLREAPGTLLEHCVDDDDPEPVAEDLPLREVAERLASYDLLAVPVCDRRQPAGRRGHRRRRARPGPARRLAAKGPPMIRRREDLSQPRRPARAASARTTTLTPSAGSPRASPGSSAPAGSSSSRPCSSSSGSRSTSSAVSLRWDPYPFILLNLAFSTQAAYAAPLILLAQNRQDERDRAQAEPDRAESARTQADTEFLARELTSVRLALADVVTADDLRDRRGTGHRRHSQRVTHAAGSTRPAAILRHLTRPSDEPSAVARRPSAAIADRACSIVAAPDAALADQSVLTSPARGAAPPAIRPSDTPDTGPRRPHRDARSGRECDGGYECATLRGAARLRQARRPS